MSGRKRTAAALIAAVLIGTVVLTAPSAIPTKGTTMSKLPSTGPSLQRYLRQQARTAQRQQQSSSFNRSGLSPTAEGVTTVDGELDVTGALVVDGSETVNGPLAVHGTAAFDGNTTIGGNAAITGTLSLPAGIINNDALTSPVEPESRWLDASNFGLTTAWVAKVTISVVVPAGFTQMQVMAAGRLNAVNSTAAADALYSKITIGAATQSGFPIPVLAGGANTSVTALTTTLTGLTSGGTVSIVLWGLTGNAAWATSAANAADLSVSLLWLR